MSSPANVARVQQILSLLEEVRQEALALYPRIDAGSVEPDADVESVYGELYDALEGDKGDPKDPQTWTVRDAVWEVLQAWDQREAGE